jgi:hypothetical protein
MLDFRLRSCARNGYSKTSGLAAETGVHPFSNTNVFGCGLKACRYLEHEGRTNLPGISQVDHQRSALFGNVLGGFRERFSAL